MKTKNFFISMIKKLWNNFSKENCNKNKFVTFDFIKRNSGFDMLREENNNGGYNFIFSNKDNNKSKVKKIINYN